MNSQKLIHDDDHEDGAELQKLTNCNDEGGGGGDGDVESDGDGGGEKIMNKKNFYEKLNGSELGKIDNDDDCCDKNINIDDDKQLNDDINDYLRNMKINDDTSCGFWIFRGKFLQRFANKKAYVILYGIVGCIYSMTYAYFNGTITTIEKRYKIPSRNTGIITVGNDISQMFVSAVLSYYAGKGHRPRWIGLGLLTIVAFCLLNAVPHFIYGSGDAALQLTKEYGAIDDISLTNTELAEQQKQTLCKINGTMAQCETGDGNIEPQLILFLAQFISGIGGSLYYTLGVSYMDDNIKKSKTPALLSLSYFMRMLGPAVGYSLSSFCLRLYISPTLTPVITDKDPRWLGAWWLGWLFLGAALFLSSIFLAMFPRQLPRAAARKIVEQQRQKQKSIENNEKVEHESELPASFKDMLKTFKKLCSNSTLMCNNFASIFYVFGYIPYWIFTPKYIEIQYRQSAATSSLVTGTVALTFSAIGVLLSGFVISRYKPSARYMAAWNVACGLFSVLGIVGYAFLGCPGNEKSIVVNIPNATSLTPTCNSACQCDYVQYAPVCGEDGNQYISPCHAGCKTQSIGPNGKKLYYNCSCITEENIAGNLDGARFERFTDSMNRTNVLDVISNSNFNGGQAVGGSCPVDCFNQFVTFLAVMCFMKFIGATGRASNFLVGVRCVPEKDKTVAIGFGLMMMSCLAFIPSPIFFGWVLDSLCLVWGKTCTTKGNCWLYNAESVRLKINIISSIFVAIGTLLDIGVWYFVKDLKIFDEEINDKEMKTLEKKDGSGGATTTTTEKADKKSEI